MQDNITDKVIAGLNQTTQDFLETLSLFSQEQFNKIPFKDSWSAGQVAEHVFKSESGVTGLLRGKNKPTERDPAQFVEQLRNAFLDFNSKMKSPEFILPSEEEKDKDQLYRNLKMNREKIAQLAGLLDLSKTYYDVSFPGFGEMTGIEWLNFITYHMKRHTQQLKNISGVLNQESKR